MYLVLTSLFETSALKFRLLQATSTRVVWGQIWTILTSLLLQEEELKETQEPWVKDTLKILKRSSPTGLRVTFRSVWALKHNLELCTMSPTQHFFFFFPFSQNPCRESLSLSWTSCVLQPHGSFIIWLLTYSDWDFMFLQIRTARELPRSACLQREYRLTINALRGTVTDDFYEVLNLKNVVSLCLIHLIHSLITFPSCWLMQVQDICHPGNLLVYERKAMAMKFFLVAQQ